MSGDEGVRVALGDPLRCQLLAHVVRLFLGEHQHFAWTSQNSDNGLLSLFSDFNTKRFKRTRI